MLSIVSVGSFSHCYFIIERDNTLKRQFRAKSSHMKRVSFTFSKKIVMRILLNLNVTKHCEFDPKLPESSLLSLNGTVHKIYISSLSKSSILFFLLVDKHVDSSDR